MLRNGPAFCNLLRIFSCQYQTTPLDYAVSVRATYGPHISIQPLQIMIRAGILSDTHLRGLNSHFSQVVEQCFADCDVIIHAGDLTDISILEIFSDKKVYAVHGNMCNSSTSTSLPEKRVFQLNDFTIGLTHGAGLGHDIESALWDYFPEADCMIYGHTHRPVCHHVAKKLIINPGSFQETGRYGAPGTFAILEAGDTLRATIHEVSQRQ